jgi:hypothetical protein
MLLIARLLQLLRWTDTQPHTMLLTAARLLQLLRWTDTPLRTMLLTAAQLLFNCCSTVALD